MSGALSNPLTFNGGYTADSGASFRFGFRQYSTATSSFTTPDQGGSGEKYTFASGNPAVLTDQLGLYSWSNFLQDVNHVSGWVSNGAGIVAMGCAATVVCAPAAPIAGGIAAVGAAVNVASGVAISGASCTDLKGSCSGAVATAAIVGIGSRFGAGKLASRAADDGVDFFRGARGTDRPSFAPRSNEYRVDPATGFVKSSHGVSVFDNPGSLRSKGFTPHRIDRSSFPKELQIIQRGNDPRHFEIVPRPGSNLSPDEFGMCLSRIECIS